MSSDGMGGAVQSAFLAYTRGDGRKTEHLASMLGYSTSLLYRICNANDAAAEMKAATLLPFMTITRRHEPLRFLARGLGAAVLFLPKRLPKMTARTVLDLQRSFVRTVDIMTAFCDGQATRPEAIAQIDDLVEQLLLTRRILERGSELAFDTAQGELFSNDR